VPFSYPLKDFAGTQILDWGTYERNYESHSLPGEVLTKISERFPAYPFGEEMSRDVPSGISDFSRVRAQLLAGTALKGNVIQWLMSRQPWDFLMAVFSETHPAGHYFWGLHSNGYDGSFPELATTIRDTYKAVDEQIAKIVEALDEETTLLVLSGQGMGPNAPQWHLIPDVLSKLGLLVTKKKNDQKSVTRTHWLSEVRNLIPLDWRRSVSRNLPGTWRDHLRSYWATSRVDWSQTRAFDLPTDLLGYIRINLKGREPQGLVEPGAEYNDICMEISAALKELLHPHTGKPIVREVFRTDLIFPGPQRDRLPDLIVTWLDDSEIQQAYSTDISTTNGNLPDPRAGNHRPKGFALFYGPRMKNRQVSEGHILDIAPTVLHHFGLKPSGDIDGRAWTNLIS
jgi:predicted AlkP superfamily phosphohydrolase/phosphomutase